MDGNVKRILSRLIASTKPVSQDLNRFWQVSDLLLDRQSPREFNQALMDLGAMICTPKNPKCVVCPLNKNCAAYSLGDPAQFPVKDLKQHFSFQVIGLGIVLNSSGKVLIDQRPREGLLGGLWEFPGGKQEKGEIIEETIKRELKEELSIEVEVCDHLISINHAYSHKKLKFVVHICKLIKGDPKPLASQQVRWVDIKNLSKYPFPAANTKIIKALLHQLGEK